jgi:hypothetical protein
VGLGRKKRKEKKEKKMQLLTFERNPEAGTLNFTHSAEKTGLFDQTFFCKPGLKTLAELCSLEEKKEEKKGEAVVVFVADLSKCLCIPNKTSTDRKQEFMDVYNSFQHKEDTIITSTFIHRDLVLTSGIDTSTPARWFRRDGSLLCSSWSGFYRYFQYLSTKIPASDKIIPTSTDLDQYLVDFSENNKSMIFPDMENKLFVTDLGGSDFEFDTENNTFKKKNQIINPFVIHFVELGVVTASLRFKAFLKPSELLNINKTYQLIGKTINGQDHISHVPLDNKEFLKGVWTERGLMSGAIIVLLILSVIFIMLARSHKKK